MRMVTAEVSPGIYYPSDDVVASAVSSSISFATEGELFPLMFDLGRLYQRNLPADRLADELEGDDGV